jgi:outer membrane protein
MLRTTALKPERSTLMNKQKILPAALAAALALAGVTSAHAADAGDWVVKVGAHVVDPKSDNGTLAGGTLKATINNDTKPTITAEYMFTPNLGVEVLAALPFKHTLYLNGAKAATFEHLPPVVSLQYHFNTNGTVSPFIGAGLNYTLVFNEKTYGPLAGTKLSIGDSFGLAAHAGVDFKLNDKWLFTVDARYIGLGVDAKVNGAKVGKVHVDPMVYGVAVGYRF